MNKSRLLGAVCVCIFSLGQISFANAATVTLNIDYDLSLGDVYSGGAIGSYYSSNIDLTSIASGTNIGTGDSLLVNVAFSNGEILSFLEGTAPIINGTDEEDFYVQVDGDTSPSTRRCKKKLRYSVNFQWRPRFHCFNSVHMLYAESD